jgi:hypothetical protein
MKAITVTQPWATLIAVGHKRIETRSWQTHYRGTIAIHAAKTWTKADKAFAAEEVALGRLPVCYPLGAVVATARLVDCRRTQELALEISGLERHLGNYDWGRWGFVLEDVEPLEEPVWARGALGLWEWTR